MAFDPNFWPKAMKILYVAPKIPFPLLDGGCYAMFQLIKSLHASGNHLNALLFETHKHPWSSSAENEFSTYFRQVEVLKIDTRIRPFGAFSALLRRKNYNLDRFRNKEIVESIQEKVQTGIELIIFDGLFAAACLLYLSLPKHVRVIIRTHNVEHEIWRGLAQEQRKGIKKSYLQQLSDSMAREELRILSAADEIWSMTSEDCNSLLKLGVKTPIFHIPVVVSEVQSDPDLSVQGAFFLGSMNWLPNTEAVAFLVHEVWGSSTDLPPLKIAGSRSEQLQLPDFIENCGRVPDVTAFMQQSGILVAPIRSGSGVRVKLLEALAAGVPCITSPLGALGIDTAESGILLAESPEEFRMAIKRLAGSTVLREELSTKGRAYIRKYHSFEAVTALISERLGN